MARTAPAPNIPPIPGMCPSIAVLAGGGDGGGGSGGSAGDGDGDNNAGAGKGGEDAAADGRGAPDHAKYPECGTASHPVDVVTGRAFTHPIVDLELPGPLPLRFARTYSSKMAGRDAGLGFGWGHTFGWEIEVKRRSVVVWNEQGVAVDFPMIAAGAEVIGPWGWVLRRETWGFAVDADDGVWHLFSVAEDEGRRFRLTAIEDRNRNRVALTYDEGRLVEVKDSAGRTIRLAPTREGRIGSIQVQNALSQGQWVAFATYAYDDRGDLGAATDADGHIARYTYDEDHRLTSDTDRAGLCFHFVYDAEGRCVESWGDYPGKRDPSLADDLPRYLYDGKTRAKGIHHCRFEYGADGYSEVIDSTQVRRFFGTKHGTLKKRVEAGGVMTATYRDDGHLLSRTDVMGAITNFERDARGRITMVTDPLGRVTTIERDAAGLPVQIVDPAGGVTQAPRDARGNVLAETDALGGVTSYRYDERGLVTEIVDARGARTACTRDAHGNLVALVEPSGAAWRYTFDALGRLLGVADPLGGSTRYAYSARGDLVAVYDAAGGSTRYAYDGERHLVEIVDGSGHAARLTWGGYHKLCARRDAGEREVRLAYNAEGELTTILNERGEAHRLTRDPSGRLIAETTFDGRTSHYKNDALGRAVIVTDALGGKTRFTYDAAGQLVARELPDGSAEELDYDARGAMIAARWGGGEVRFERDALGRIVREAQRVGDEEHAVEITYDPEGERVGRRTSLGHDEAVERDAAGARRRTVLDGHAVEHTRSPVGRELARALAGGGRIESAYDPVGRLAQRRALGPAAQRRLGAGEPELLGPHADGATLATSFAYDPTGELVTLWDGRRGGTTHEYDPVGQLLARVPEKARAEVFRYDAAGNAHPAGSEGRDRAYGPGGRLLHDGVTRYTWDDAGRLATKELRDPATAQVGRWSYRWNGAGLLASATAPDGMVADFAYDPFARRVQKRISRPSRPGDRPTPVSLTRFVWDGDVLVHEITRAARASGDPVVEVRTYAFEDDGFEPLAHRDGLPGHGGEGDAPWFHYVNDHAGAPAYLVDAEGRVACELVRGAWGRTEIAPGARTQTPIRYQGQYEDAETGLSYNRFRYYDPETGRFISPDPAGPAGGLGPFAIDGNPISFADPLGLWGDKDVAALQTGGNGTAVTVKSKKEADALLKASFPDYQKVNGTGSQDPSGERKKRKLDRFKEGGAYHKDYAMDPKTGRVCGHADPSNPHGAHPHINIKRTDGVKVEIRIVK